MEKDKCEQKYYMYIENHIRRVNKVWQMQISKIDDDFIRKNSLKLSERMKNHDKSKFDEDEFEAYRANYFPIDEEEKINNKSNYKSAWQHHIRLNDHHWQHYLDGNKNLKPIEDLYIIKSAYIEMLCDWQAMGEILGDNALKYYNENKEKIKLYPELKQWFEKLLYQLDRQEHEQEER